jgi:hypothetical protein
MQLELPQWALPTAMCRSAAAKHVLSANGSAHVSHVVSKELSLTSERYNFSYHPNVGKVGSTSVKLFLYKVLCLLYTNTSANIDFSAASPFAYSPWKTTLCGEKLQDLRLLSPRPSERSPPARIDFTVVRDPFARAVSTYQYVVEKYASQPKHWRQQGPQNQSFCDYYSPANFQIMFNKATLGAFFFGRFGADSRSSHHWEPQSPGLAKLCEDMKDSLAVLQLEALTPQLGAIVQEINTGMQGSLPPLPQPSSDERANTAEDFEKRYGRHAQQHFATCPWQCYYEVCGSQCLDGVKKHYSADLHLLHNYYRIPDSVEELWHGPYREKSMQVPGFEDTKNRTSSCSACLPRTVSLGSSLKGDKHETVQTGPLREG